MSGPDTHDDDALDAMLASLGTPEGAVPVASSAEILARAAALAPPVAAGLGGWKLAAALLLTLGGGFAGGWWFGRDEAPKLAALTPGSTAVAPAAAAPTKDVPGPLATGPTGDGPGPLATASDPESTIDAVAPHLAPKTVIAAIPASAACPEPGPTPTFEDLAAWLGDMPVAPDDPPDAPGEPTETLAATLAREDEADVTTRVTSDRRARDVAIRAGVGPLIAPAASTGMRAELALVRPLDPTSRAGFELGGDLGLGLINGPIGAVWDLDLSAEASRARRFGRTELNLGWTAGARLLLPARREDTPAPEISTELQGPHLLPLTGPRLALSLGDPTTTRLNLALSAQLSPTVERDALQPWISLSVGGVVPSFKKRDG